MTATQVFILFLKKRCTIKEYLFFKSVIMKDNGNKFFRIRPLYKNTFVEDYLSRNNRTLSNFMTRVFILAPNLVKKRCYNPRLELIQRKYNDHQAYVGSDRRFMSFRAGMYVEYYRKEWNKFLREHIVSEKKINSPFKKGEKYDFKYKDDTYL